MTAPLGRTKQRCGCGALLGIRHDGALHLKYKDFSATLRSGVIDLLCRRCRCVVTLGSDQ